VDKKGRVWIIDINPYGSPTCPLLFEWGELNTLTDYTVRIVESEAEKLSSTVGMSRGPIDVHMAPDFHNFMRICKKQQDDGDDSD
jgi:hypothetical protein